MDFRDIKEFMNDMMKYIITAFVVIFIVVYIVSVQQVVGPSMNPTLKEGDILILDKISYRMRDIRRNEVVALKYDASKYLVKRIIGLPGENIAYKDNYLYIDGKKYQETIYDNMKTEDFTLEEIAGVDKIPDDMYLVLGDNRGNSQDSRDSKIGLIKKSDIIGRTFIRIWPLNGIKLVK